MKRKLFVYGTLKRGLSNHHYLAGATYLGRARTKERYPLVAPKRWYPYLINAPGEGQRVVGELYEIDAATLKRIDRLEEYPSYYTRREIEVEDEAGRSHRAIAYFLARPIPYRQWRYLEEFHPPQE
jgi:gamma-glutamylaminecyclotransferase